MDDETAPLRLPLGPEAVTRIREKLRGQLADLERWEPLSVATRYPVERSTGGPRPQP